MVEEDDVQRSELVRRLPVYVYTQGKTRNPRSTGTPKTTQEQEGVKCRSKRRVIVRTTL